ncbi:hypothetical protein COV61_02090 [Candidatus Micrarchaeota archaeon CG11_big_fil_rev_8_21_14_0_20_47_5]|nr:MAG: hypothetical protein AUJ17_01905 [Candidatus Micrarchaeota archaeon CG1_02_47_40]PIN83791.1 MAG: hypothetical protein COV61_02090 [Candidatus Micrarchaeota archaeon CG11_big_fil_rev_8_21_14_0_20_47_5]
MLVGAKFLQKIALEQMLILAGEAGFDFVLLEEKEKKKGEKDNEVGDLLASYAIALFSKKEGILEVSESEGEEAIAKLRGENVGLESKEAIVKLKEGSGLGGVAVKLKEGKSGEGSGSELGKVAVKLKEGKSGEGSGNDLREVAVKVSEKNAKAGGRKKRSDTLKQKKVLESKEKDGIVKPEEKKSVKIAICTNETEVDKLMGARERFERLYFGKDYVKRNREYLNP